MTDTGGGAGSGGGPFREEDLAARVDALRAERDTLRRALDELVRGRPRRAWSVGRFVLGLAVCPVGVVFAWWVAAGTHP